MAVVSVALTGRPYDVHIASRLLTGLGQHCAGFLRKKAVPVITDTHVHAHWGQTVTDALRQCGHEPHWRILPAGEASKSWQELEATVSWLLGEGVERGDHILALGGGVIGDLTGFAAAITKRGCHFIQLPTTLLAQVDSSVGGKTGINTSAGKNLVGAFHQPSLVLADLDALATLPIRELRAGYAEVLKYGLLGDAEFFAWCNQHGRAMLEADVPQEATQLREFAVARSVTAKANIVAEDELETTGKRALLNLGHTFGHALEAETGFSGRLLHGEGVGIGMVLAARYSSRLGLISAADAEHAEDTISEGGLATKLHEAGLNCSGQTLVHHMLHDKKMDAGRLPFVLLRGIGQAFLSSDVDLDDVARFLDDELIRE